MDGKNFIGGAKLFGFNKAYCMMVKFPYKIKFVIFHFQDIEHSQTLSIISAVGCAISMVCLILTIVAHAMVWR